jgi:hypothetical protein
MPLGGALTGLAIAGAASGAGGVIGGLIGQGKASGDFQNANEAAQKAAQQLINTGMPPDLARQIVLQQYKSQGILTPELEQAITLGPSAVANISEDPKLRQAQMAALQQYTQAGQTGQTAQDQLNNLKMQNQINADNRSRQASILQGAQARGEAGSGASLAAQLQASQGDANLASEQGLQLAAQANQARMNALGQQAGLGSQLRSQDFGVNQAKANAADQFQRFNVQNQQAVANQNVQAKNQAQAANLANNQQLSNANVAQNNAEAQRQNQARLTDWQSQNQRNSIIAGGYTGQANQYNQMGNQVANQDAQMGRGIGGMLGTVANLSGAFKPSSGTTGLTQPMVGDSAMSSAGSNTGGALGNGNYSFGDMGKAHGGMIEEPCYSEGGETESSEDSENEPHHLDVIVKSRHPLPTGNVGESSPKLIEDDYTPFSEEYKRPHYSQGGLALSPNSMLPYHMKILNHPHFADGGMPQQQQVPQYQPPQFPMQQPVQQPQQYMQGQPQQRFMPTSGVLNAQHGAMVPGHANAPGDNYKNDVVHAMLSPDECVVPRSIMTQPDAPERAKEFIKGLLAARKRGR